MTDAGDFFKWLSWLFVLELKWNDEKSTLVRITVRFPFLRRCPCNCIVDLSFYVNTERVLNRYFMETMPNTTASCYCFHSHMNALFLLESRIGKDRFLRIFRIPLDLILFHNHLRWIRHRQISFHHSRAVFTHPIQIMASQNEVCWMSENKFEEIDTWWTLLSLFHRFPPVGHVYEK